VRHPSNDALRIKSGEKGRRPGASRNLSLRGKRKKGTLICQPSHAPSRGGPRLYPLSGKKKDAHARDIYSFIATKKGPGVGFFLWFQVMGERGKGCPLPSSGLPRYEEEGQAAKTASGEKNG